MSIGAIGGSTPYAAPPAEQNQQGAEEITTITTNCKSEKCEERRAHDRSCPHTVSTRPAPKVGENGYLLDKTV